MRGRTLTLRFIALLIFLLIVYPTLFAFFVQSSSFSNGLRTSFLLFKQPLLAILAMTLFFLFAKSQSSNFILSRLKEFSVFFFIGTLCLVLSSITQVDLNRILNSGISIQNKKVHWDAQRWGVLPFLSEADPVGEQYLWVRTPEQRLMKTLKGTVPKKRGQSPLARTTNDERRTAVLKWYGLWRDGNGNGVLDDRVWLSINGQRYDVSEQYRAISTGTSSILAVEIPLAVMPSEAENLAFILSKEGSTDAIGWVAGTTYLLGQTHEWEMPAGGEVSPSASPNLFGGRDGGENGKWKETPFMEALVWVEQPNDPVHSFLFKIGYLLRWLGMALLFFAFFGRRWILCFARQSPLLTIVSFAYAPLVLLLGIGLRQSWPWLAQGVGYSLYGLLHFGFTPFIDVKDATHVIVGTGSFSVNIADTCSGIESVGLFCAMYLGLVLFNYKHLRLSRALFLIIPGLIGMYLVNLVRIYILFLVGLIAGEVALNAFHTYLGIVFFVLYFLLLWQKIQQWIAKNPIPRHEFRFAPAVASATLIFSLMMGHEMILPTQQSLANGQTSRCDGWAWAQYCAVVDSNECWSSQYKKYSLVGWNWGGDCTGVCAWESWPPFYNTCAPQNSCTTRQIGCYVIPEFPPFLPLLFSLLAPFLRLRWFR